MADDGYTLVIGSKATSSWSLRSWVLMRHVGLAFDEILVRLRREDTREQILRHSPSGKVPALKWRDLTIPDSLAIAEFLADRHRDLRLWPEEIGARALARSVSCEMHAGFAALRNELPMECISSLDCPALSPDAGRDIARIVEIWRGCRARASEAGPFLFGTFTIADAMYAPVASRFATYAVDLAGFGDDGTAAAYAATLLGLPEMAQWCAEAREAA